MKMLGMWITLTLILAACSQNVTPQSEIAANPQTPAVFGGDEVGANEIIARTTVGIYNNKLGYLCTGSLYGLSHVITAAHCLEGDIKNLEVRFGVDMHRPLFIRAVTAGLRHPNYRAQIAANNSDIAVIKYEGTLPEGYGFRTVSILSNYAVLGKGTDIIAAGYGVKGATLGNGSGVLRKVTLEVKDPRYSSTEISVKQGLFKGVCSGDSGGPAFFRGKDGVLYLWGTTSNGAGIPKVRACMFRSVFTRVDVHAAWINETLRSL